MNSNRILIIIPTYNEIENLPKLIKSIVALDLSIHILVVDDGSPDGTGQWVKKQMKTKEYLHCIQRSKKMGLGTAYVEGFRFAIQNKYDIVFEMDADFSHNPKYILDFLKEIKSHDVVLGSRYLNGINVVNWPLKRVLLSYFANIYARLITGIPIQDLTSGYKCFKVNALEKIDLDKIYSDGYSFQIEISYRLWKLKAKFKEISIVFVDRQAGYSKMSGKIIREALWLLFFLRFKR